MNAPASPILFPGTRVRRVTMADLPEMLDIAEEMYPGRGIRAAEGWARFNIENRDGTKLALRGDNAILVAHAYHQYGFELRARVDMLCARRQKRAWLEALQLVKACKRWAALIGVTHPLRLDADTGVDFGPFAKRLGGRKVDPDRYPVYEIPLDGGRL